MLFFMEPRQVRLVIAMARMEPAGRRPHAGRGRAPLVFDADILTDILAAFTNSLPCTLVCSCTTRYLLAIIKRSCLNGRRNGRRNWVAQRITTEQIDDLTGVSSNDDPTVTTRYFSFNGRDYSIDLADVSLKLMEDALQPFTEVARRHGGNGQRGVPRSTASRTRSREIRDWARGKGYKFSDRGRLPANIVKDWEHEHAA